MLTHQAPVLSEYTRDHGNSLSLLSTCIPDSFNLCLLLCPLNGIQNLKPFHATHRHPGHAQRSPVTVDCRGQEREKGTLPGCADRLSTTDSALGILWKPSRVGVSMPRRRKLVNAHGEGTPWRGKFYVWMGFEMGAGRGSPNCLLTSNSRVLHCWPWCMHTNEADLVHCLCLLSIYLPCVEEHFSVVFYHREGAWDKAEPGDLQDRTDPWPETLGSDLSCLPPRRMPSLLPALCLLPEAFFQTETL